MVQPLGRPPGVAEARSPIRFAQKPLESSTSAARRLGSCCPASCPPGRLKVHHRGAFLRAVRRCAPGPGAATQAGIAAGRSPNQRPRGRHTAAPPLPGLAQPPPFIIVTARPATSIGVQAVSPSIALYSHRCHLAPP
ncbi:hypothetical protein NL676_035105 [Syzygium grande]|nr:hypothetical protein NL676_035105 [Syzygium grande]